jgi:hypothetical protein
MRTTPRTVLAIGSAALLALTAAACTTDGSSSDVTVESTSFDFGGDALTVKAGSADLELVAADVDGVEVERRISGTKVGGEITTGWELEGDTLTLSADCTGISLGCTATYVVQVSPDVAIVADSGDGSIDATGFTADFSAVVDNGDVTLSDLDGPNLTVESRDGRIDGSGIAATSVRAVSRNGDVTLDLTSVPDLVEVETQDGDVRLDLPEAGYAVDTSTKKGDVTVDATKDDTSDHVVTARTRNGDVVVR